MSELEILVICASIFSFLSLHIDLPAAQILQETINVIAMHTGEKYIKYWREKSLVYYKGYYEEKVHW